MRAFVDTVETKEQAIAAMQSHYDAGRIAQCTCYKKNRGRAFVCKYYGHYYSVERVHGIIAERVHGIPRALARLEDEIFNGLSEAEAQEWPLQYLTAINVGSDLSQVTDKFILRILEDEDRGVIAFVKAGSYVHSAVARVIDLYRRKIAGEHVKKEELENAAMAWRLVQKDKSVEWAAVECVSFAASELLERLDADEYEDDFDSAYYSSVQWAGELAYTDAMASVVPSTALDDRIINENTILYLDDFNEVHSQKHYAWMRDVLLDIIRNEK